MIEPARRLGDLLRGSGRTISVAESCTAGGLGQAITRVPGASDYFVGGVIAYADRIKARLLSVDGGILGEHGAVSPEVAEAMAAGCRALLGTDLAIAVTGIAGPAGGTPEKPVGLVFVAVADDAGVEVRRFGFRGTRDEIRTQATAAALETAIDRLLAAR